MLTLLKPLLYLGICLVAHARWASPTDRWMRPVAMAIVRVLAGLLAGIPVGMVFASVDVEGVLGLLVMAPVRFVLWAFALRVFYPATSRAQWIGFSLAAAACSTAIDAIDSGGESMLHAVTHFRMC